MKKVRYILIIGFMLSLLAACKNADKNSSKDESESKVETTNKATTKPDEKKTGEKQLSETQVQIGDHIISLNDDMADVIKVLGESKDFSESKSCLYDGNDKVYTYDKIVITTYPKGDKDYISGIEIVSDGVSIQSGIKVGDNVEDVKAKFDSNKLNVSEVSCSYETDNYGIELYLKDKTVDAIEIYQITE